MMILFTPVKKYVEEGTDFISRLLGQSAKNGDSHAISTPEIRDMTPKTI